MCANLDHPQITFNPHFTRTLSETLAGHGGGGGGFGFQSSFYKDTLWNRGRGAWSHKESSLSILILQGHSLKPGASWWLWGLRSDLSILILQGHSLKQYICLSLEEILFHLSILILQGHSLKQSRELLSAQTLHFQSSFYKDTLWNRNCRVPGIALKRSFNPHFTRTLSETIRRCLACWTSAGLSILILQGHSLKPEERAKELEMMHIFQSSFYKDTLWNFSNSLSSGFA